MQAVCTFKGNSYWCKINEREFIIATKHSISTSNNIRNNRQIIEVKIHDEIEEFFPVGLSAYFPRLKSLTVSYCGLKSITRGDLIGLEDLETLDLTANLLRSLPSDLFIGMAKLKNISFIDNKLETMSSKLLEPFVNKNPTLLDFRGNSNINAFLGGFCSGNHYKRGISLEELMKLIDTNCKKPEGEQSQLSTIESFKDDFVAGFADLWASGEHSDFTIIANGSKEFRVHKTVLAMQSSVFSAMFKNNMEEQQTGMMKILGFTAEAVEQFLACLYTGEIKDVTYAMEVFALAAKYDVPKLKTTSEQNVLENIDNFNACDVFALGHLHSSTDMQRKAFVFIKQTLPDLDDDLMKDPEGLKALFIAIEKRQKKIQEAEDEFASLCISKK